MRRIRFTDGTYAQQFSETLAAAAGRGVRVRLPAAGIEIHEYQPTMMHAKTMVVDGAFSELF